MKKIVIIGPESTGKSTLCEELATHFNTGWCPEYAREYLLKNGTEYSYDDLLTIAKGQVTLEEMFVGKDGKSGSREVGESGSRKDGKTFPNADDSSVLPDSPTFGLPVFQISGLPSSASSRLLFIDTDMYVMKVWCEFVFDNCHRYILDQIVERKYDLYLLCNVDLPWVKDELREYPDLENRLKLYYIYKDIMINQSVPWVDISGDYKERLQKAIAAVDEFLKE